MKILFLNGPNLNCSASASRGFTAKHPERHPGASPPARRRVGCRNRLPPVQLRGRTGHMDTTGARRVRRHCSQRRRLHAHQRSSARRHRCRRRAGPSRFISPTSTRGRNSGTNRSSRPSAWDKSPGSAPSPTSWPSKRWQRRKASQKNNLSILACPFARWLRCSLVTARCGDVPRSRLASGQKSRAIIAQVIFSRRLRLKKEFSHFVSKRLSNWASYEHECSCGFKVRQNPRMGCASRGLLPPSALATTRSTSFPTSCLPNCLPSAAKSREARRAPWWNRLKPPATFILQSAAKSWPLTRN